MSSSWIAASLQTSSLFNNNNKNPRRLNKKRAKRGMRETLFLGKFIQSVERTLRKADPAWMFYRRLGVKEYT